MAIEYIPEVHQSKMPNQFLTFNNKVYERKRVELMSISFWNRDAVPTVIQSQLSNWSLTPKGQWISEYGANTFHMTSFDHSNDQVNVAIFTYLPQQKWTEYYLRFLDN